MSVPWDWFRRRISALAGPTSVAILARGGQTLLAFVLARALGVESYGVFIFALGSAILAGMVAGFGWPNVVNRELPQHLRSQDYALLRGLNRAADACTLLFSAACALCLFIASLLLPQFAAGLRMAAFLTPPFAMIFLRQQQLVAVDRPTHAFLLDQGMAATIVCVIFLLHPMGRQGALATYGAVLVGLIVIGTVVYKRHMPPSIQSVGPEYQIGNWLASGWAMFSSMLSRILVTRLDVLMVAPLAGFMQAGLFGSAFRLTLLMTFPQFILQALITPRFARAFSAGDAAQVRKLYGASVAFVFLTAVPFLLPALIVPHRVMSALFGPDFAAGGTALSYLAVGQFVAAFGISLNSMIAMGGDHRAMGRQGVVIAVLTFAAGYALVPSYGAVGAALVLLASNVLWVLGMARLALPLLGKSSPPGKVR